MQQWPAWWHHVVSRSVRFLSILTNNEIDNNGQPAQEHAQLQCLTIWTVSQAACSKVSVHVIPPAISGAVLCHSSTGMLQAAISRRRASKHHGLSLQHRPHVGQDRVAYPLQAQLTIVIQQRPQSSGVQ